MAPCFFNCVFLFFYMLVLAINQSQGKACQDLGYIDYHSEYGPDYCEDLAGNIHYVKMECKGFGWLQCDARQITVGGVREWR